MNRAAENITQAADAPAASNRAEELLLEFLREHDAACPVCGYNLKALTRAICPECGQELMLTVGAARLRFGWLMAAVAPGFFSGIAAFFLLVPIIVPPMFNHQRWSLTLIGMDLFGWSSGIFAILLAAKRHRFLALPGSTQRWSALGIWMIHAAALGMVFLIGPRFL